MRVALEPGDHASNAAALMHLICERVGFADARGLPQVHWYGDVESWETMRRSRSRLTRLRAQRPFYSPEAHAVYFPPPVTRTVERGFEAADDLDSLVSVLHEFLHAARFSAMRTLRIHLIEALTEGAARHFACCCLVPPCALTREDVNRLLASNDVMTDVGVQALESLAVLTNDRENAAQAWLREVIHSHDPAPLLRNAVARLLRRPTSPPHAERVLRSPSLLHRALAAAHRRTGGGGVPLGAVWYPQGLTI